MCENFNLQNSSHMQTLVFIFNWLKISSFRKPYDIMLLWTTIYKWMLLNIHSTYKNNATVQNNRKGNLLSHHPVMRHSHSKDITENNSPKILLKTILQTGTLNFFFLKERLFPNRNHSQGLSR